MNHITNGSKQIWTPCGLVGRPHGVKGFFHVVSQQPHLLKGVAQVCLKQNLNDAGMIVDVLNSFYKNKILVMQTNLWTAREHVVPAMHVCLLKTKLHEVYNLEADNEYWVSDLKGSVVVNRAQPEQVFGVVKNVVNLGAQENFEIEHIRPDGTVVTTLYPFVESFVSVNLEQKKIAIEYIDVFLSDLLEQGAV